MLRVETPILKQVSCEDNLKIILILLHINLLHNKNMLQIVMNAKNKIDI